MKGRKEGKTERKEGRKVQVVGRKEGTSGGAKNT